MCQPQSPNSSLSFPLRVHTFVLYNCVSVSALQIRSSIPFFWRRRWHPTPVLLPGKSHGWRSLVGCSPWGREESDTTEWLQFHFSLSCIGEGNGKPLQYSCLENPMNSMKRQKDRTLKDELPRSVGAQYATGDQWRNNSTKNEGMEPKQKQYPVVDVTSDRSKVRCCKEQYCIGTWNVRSMN